MLTTIGKAGDVLALFTREQPEWGVREIAMELGAPKSNVHHILTSLATIGLLHRTSRSRYRLGWRLLALGEKVAASSINRAGTAIMRELSQRSGATVQLSVFDGAETVLVGRVLGPHGAAQHRAVGDTLPSHASASGKLLLAHHHEAWARHTAPHRLTPLTAHTVRSIEQLREELSGITEGLPATDVEESRVGVACVASPVRDSDGEVAAAVSMTATLDRFTANRAAYIRAVQHAARRFSAQLADAAEAAS
jgi:DNA-binding IclR family transcriptional regulator